MLEAHHATMHEYLVNKEADHRYAHDFSFFLQIFFIITLFMCLPSNCFDRLGGGNKSLMQANA